MINKLGINMFKKIQKIRALLREHQDNEKFNNEFFDTKASKDIGEKIDLLSSQLEATNTNTRASNNQLIMHLFNVTSDMYSSSVSLCETQKKLLERIEYLEKLIINFLQKT